jgi:RNA polymerase sigma factor (sigma-70 family)
MNDWELLKEFAATGSDSAFERLVSRYGGLVHSVALRDVRDPHRAQDVAQAVFILLAQRAGNLREGTVLSGWLFRTTRFVAQRANRSEQRRQHREKEAVTMNEHSSADQNWQRIAPVVDEALEQLGATDRNALLLRFFEGRNICEVGNAFGIAEEAAKKRVARALEKLRSIMVRRGWHLSTTLLAAALAEQANASITPQLAAQLVASAIGSAPPATAAALADQVIAAWRWMKLRLAMGVTVAALSIATLFVFAKPDKVETTAGLAPSPTPPPVLESAPNAAAATPTPEAPSEMKLLRFRVVSAESGAGLANARVGVAAWGNPDRWDVKTDANGWCDIRYPDTVARLDVGAVADGWAPRFVTWPAEGSSQFAQEYTLRLEPVTNVIGGWVRDPAGQPVADVGIHFQAHGTGDSSHRERPRERFGFIHSIPAVRTDANGRWSINFVPAQHPGFQIEARHPDYAASSVVNSDQQESELWAGTLVTTLNPALTLTGVVVDEQNAPIAGAKIQQREQGEVFRTDAAGTFRVPKLRPGPWAFTASAEGYAPARTTLEVVPKMAPVTVTLKAGSVLRIVVLDEHDNAVPNATVGLQRWGEHFPSVLEWREKTGDDGRVEWRCAPGDSQLELYARADGFCWTRNIHLKADGEEHVVRLRRALEVYGRVVDAEKGFGIPDFRVVPRYGASITRQSFPGLAGRLCAARMASSNLLLSRTCRPSTFA